MSNNSEPNTPAVDQGASAPQERPSQAVRALRENQGSMADLLNMLLTPVKQKQQQTDQLISALQANITDLSKQFRDLTSVLKDQQINSQEQIHKTVAAITEAVSAQAADIEQRLAAATQRHVETVDSHTAEVSKANETVAALVDQLRSKKGPSSIGFDLDEIYPEDSLGFTVKTLVRMLEKATSNFINLGAPIELHVTAKSITVTQTLHNVRCPATMDSVDLEVIRGGNKNDLLMLTGTGEVNVKVSGNIRLKSEYTLMTGRTLFLKKSEEMWEELWRSH